MMRIVFIYCLLSNALHASSTFFEKNTVGRSHQARKTTSTCPSYDRPDDSLVVTACSHPQRRQRTTSSVIIASADLAGQENGLEVRKRSSHNLYRLIGSVCNKVKHILRTITRTVTTLLYLNKEEKKAVTYEKRIQSFFTRTIPEEKNEIKKFLHPVSSFFSRKFPKNIPQVSFRPSLPSFPNISNVFYRIKADNGNQTSKNQYNIFSRIKSDNIFSRRIPKKNVPPEPVYILPSTWGGVPVTEKERVTLLSINERRLTIESMSGVSPWLKSATATDFLRFLRVKNGNEEDAWKMIVAHAKWRVGRHGADTIVRGKEYVGSVLHRELFWLGVSSNGLPTLVIRTQAHDGADYKEDPKVFTR